jgi:CHAT domain-containing protein
MAAVAREVVRVVLLLCALVPLIGCQSAGTPPVEPAVSPPPRARSGSDPRPAAQAYRPPHRPATRGTRSADVERIRDVNRGVFADYRRGLYAATLPRARDAVADAERALGPRHPLVASSLVNLGRLLRAVGEYGEASPPLERARAIREAAFGPEHLLVADALYELGSAHSDAGNVAAARAAFERALAIRERALGREHPGVGWAAVMLGRTLLQAGDPRAASPWVARAAAIAEQGGPRTKDEPRARLLGLALHLQGMIASRTGDHGAARALLARGLAVREQTLGPEHPLLAPLLGGYGASLSRSGDDAGARPLFERALALARRHQLFEHVWLPALWLGRIAEREGKLPEAVALYRDAVAAVETVAGRFADEATRGQYVQSMRRADVYDALARALLKLHERAPAGGHDREAWAVLEARKNRVVADALTAARPVMRDDDDVRVHAQRVEEARARLTALERALATPDEAPAEDGDGNGPPGAPGGGGDASAADVTTLLARTKAEYLAAVRALLERHPRLKAQFVEQQTVDPRTLARFSERLPAGMLAVQYFVTPEALWIYTVARGGQYRVRRHEVAQDALYALVRRYREHLQRAATRRLRWTDDGSAAFRADVQPLREATERLAAHLLGPIEEELARHPALVVIPNDLLLYLPIHALTRPAPDGRRRFLVETHAVSYLTQLELAELVAAGRRTVEQPLLAVANPDGSLPAAGQEVAALAALRPAVTALAGAEATKDRFLGLTARFTDLHLATHGILDPEHPERSYLLMAGADDESRRLTIREIAGLTVSPDGMAVLSACETAMGELQPGAALMTMAAAFSQAGSQTVIASLWSVNDQATRELMLAFHGGLRTLGRAEALREAQVALLRQPLTEHPFYWAPFILIGAR